MLCNSLSDCNCFNEINDFSSTEMYQLALLRIVSHYGEQRYATDRGKGDGRDRGRDDRRTERSEAKQRSIASQV